MNLKRTTGVLLYYQNLMAAGVGVLVLGQLAKEQCNQKETFFKGSVGTNDSNSESPSGRSPLQGSTTRSAAPRPPVSRGRSQDDTDSSSSNRSSPPEVGRAHRLSLPDLTHPPSTTIPRMRHSSSAPPPPPPGQ
ncbi:unnamed protein product [Ranitomeya imitator]|uniref:Uncharacterized protein n=1 Tax=Ranitomeya imitator TaxID=111125 RepID=A0ABN9M9I7_9NEOB|nr:unnamed protein product [Ranitomeya imitator]